MLPICVFASCVSSVQRYTFSGKRPAYGMEFKKIQRMRLSTMNAAHHHHGGIFLETQEKSADSLEHSIKYPIFANELD